MESIKIINTATVWMLALFGAGATIRCMLILMQEFFSPERDMGKSFSQCKNVLFAGILALSLASIVKWLQGFF